MKNQFKIWQTAVEAFNYAFRNFKTWLKLSIASWIFGLIFSIIGALVFISSNFFLTTNTGQPHPLIALVTVILGSGIGIFGISTSLLMSATNYFRYLMLNEGGVKWLEFRFDRHMGKLLKIFLIWLVIFLAAAGIAGILIKFFPSTLILIIGPAILILALMYISLRFVFASQFAVTDVENPIKLSFEVTKGNVLKIVGLLSLVLFFSILLSFASVLLTTPFNILENLQNIPLRLIGYLGDFIIQIIMSMITTVASFTATVKAYQAISENHKKEQSSVVAQE